MYVIHIKRRKRVMLLTLAALILTAVLALLLPGCRADKPQEISAETEEQRLSYLASLGWTVEESPVETLDLQLPEKLDGDWEEYARLQESQGLPFSDFAGKTTRRYTYTLTNYPGVETGVQVNLYVSDGRLIGGDVISTGENGFQAGLTFPQQEKT